MTEPNAPLRETIDGLLTRVDELETGDVAGMNAFIVELERLHGEFQRPETQYALAYAWYFHPERRYSQKTQDAVECMLLKVLDQVPDDYLSLLYLGHNRYDLEHYQHAKAYFVRAAGRATHTYIGLKAHEMVACCEVHLVGIGEALPALESFVERAETHPVGDIFPRELAKALGQGRTKLTPDELSRLHRMATRLDEAGHFGRWFGEIAERFTF